MHYGVIELEGQDLRTLNSNIAICWPFASTKIIGKFLTLRSGGQSQLGMEGQVGHNFQTLHMMSHVGFGRYRGVK